MNDLIDAARKEEFIGEGADEDYVKCVFVSAVQNIAGPIRRIMIKENIVSKEKWLDYLYHMVVTSLVYTPR